MKAMVFLTLVTVWGCASSTSGDGGKVSDAGNTGGAGGAGGAAGAAGAGGGDIQCEIHPCAADCLAALPDVTDVVVQACLSDPNCKCTLECRISNYCKNDGFCAPNSQADTALPQLCAAKPTACDFVTCTP